MDSDISRERSRDRQRRRRKKHSKFSLEKFTKRRKSVNNLTFNELLYVGYLWGSKRVKKANRI